MCPIVLCENYTHFRLLRSTFVDHLIDVKQQDKFERDWDPKRKESNIDLMPPGPPPLDSYFRKSKFKTFISL